MPGPLFDQIAPKINSFLANLQAREQSDGGLGVDLNGQGPQDSGEVGESVIGVYLGDQSDEAYKVGDRIVYIDSDGGPPYVSAVDENNRPIEIPLTMTDVSLSGASGSSASISVPLGFDEEGETTSVFNSFIIAPDENGTLTLYASMDGDSSDLSKWVPMGPAPSDGFDEVVPGVSLKITGDSAMGWSASYTSTVSVTINEQSTTPAQNYLLALNPGSSKQVFDEGGAEVTLHDIPLAYDAVDSEIEFDQIVVVQSDDGTKRYVGVRATETEDGTATYQSYDLGYAPADAPVGTFSTSEFGDEASGGRAAEQYYGVHNSQGYTNKDYGLRDKRADVVVDENNTGSIDSPLSQGRRRDKVIVTQFYDSSGKPITYYLDGEAGGIKDDDTLVLPAGSGGESEWTRSEGHTVDGNGNYSKWVHEPTGAVVYARDYENVEFVPLESQPISADEASSAGSTSDYSGLLNVPSQSDSRVTVLASSQKVDSGNRIDFMLPESQYPFDYNFDSMTQFHKEESDDFFIDYGVYADNIEYRVDTLVDENGPVVHFVDLASGDDSVVLPGNSYDWTTLSGDDLNGSQGLGGKTVMIHRDTGAIVIMDEVNEVQYSGNYDKA